MNGKIIAARSLGWQLIAALVEAKITIPTIKVVDVGANPIDGSAPYKTLLEDGLATVVGFEPNAEALAKLNAAKSSAETYIGKAVGEVTMADCLVHFCVAPGMSSIYKLHEPLMRHFPGFVGRGAWGQVVETQKLPMTRLDDVPEAQGCDFLKIDIQGGELGVFFGAQTTLANAVFVHTEAMFVEMYENQPLFADQDSVLRGPAYGFQLHTMLDSLVRGIGPVGMSLTGAPYAGVRQVLQTDAVYCRPLEWMACAAAEKHDGDESLSPTQLLKTAVIAAVVYGSFDLAHFALLAYDRQMGTDAAPRYFKLLKSATS